MHLLDPRNGPAFDHPPDPCAPCFVIASTPRTGSTLLARTLWEAGCGAPKEYLNPMQLRDWEVRLGTPASRFLHRRIRGPAVGLVGRTWSRARLHAQLARVRSRRTHRWFGLKLHWHHHARIFRPGELDHLLGPITWIRMRRSDRVAQAVSWDHALQTGRWVSTQEARPAHYSARRIRARLDQIDHDESAWDSFLQGRAVLDVRYEAFEDGLTAVLDHLGGDRPNTLPLKPQRDALAWAARYRHHHTPDHPPER